MVCVKGFNVISTVDGDDCKLWMLEMVGAVGSMRVANMLLARLVRFSLSGWLVRKVDQLVVNMVSSLDWSLSIKKYIRQLSSILVCDLNFHYRVLNFEIVSRMKITIL